MIRVDEYWKPGSFTKNFSWGGASSGLAELHKAIRTGFNDQLEDTPRELFRERVSSLGRPDYIPMNFFLFNRVENNESLICADELVFQSLSSEHGEAFDSLALYAFLLSFVGIWKGAKLGQRRPAMWANAYVREHVAKTLDWNTDKISADDIEQFISKDPRYKGETSRKLATNLNYVLKNGQISGFAEPKITRWWVDCLFLTLDRVIEDARIDGKIPPTSAYPALIERSGFLELTGGSNIEKSLAIKHLIHLYITLGGRRRLSNEDVKILTIEMCADTNIAFPNNPQLRGAIHLTNPQILKSIPPICSELAKRAGFVVLSPDEMQNLNVREFISNQTGAALAVLRDRGIRPSMTSAELLKVTRDR